ncbi:MAG: DEXDc helicase [Hyperionvirus sp.]|uniref:DEXDc helicase n=1 Tax=Hyperionvirus sp. TaxID=2487770 RepID=A0A3G5AGS3_9VIRU|nr:MAG: DEXDc helicase [Hyperionvirus sp.]
MSYVNVCTGVAEEVKDPAMVFAYKCDEFQKHGFWCIANGENLLATAHTGSGKTTLAEYAIANTIRGGKNVVYTSPIKSLSNEKYNDFSKKYASFSGVRLGILTGDNKINPDGNCLIMTAEILRNALYRLKKEGDLKGDATNFMDKVGCVIMDEVHFINDADRGKVWEETIVLLDRNIQLIMLSATIDKAEQFAQWIGEIKQKKINLISTVYRVVPLRHYIFAGEKRYMIFDTVYDHVKFMEASKAHDDFVKKNKGGVTYGVNDLVKYLKKEKLLQAIFFSFSKKNCESYARAVSEVVVEGEEIVKIREIFNKYLFRFEKQYMKLDQFQVVKGLLLKGVAFHHSGLLPVLKEIVEIIFHLGLIKVLFATETFAVGVNMPTRTVVFMELEKFTGGGKKRSLTAGEYKQMSGRAGRRGIDVRGEVIILPVYGFPEDQLLRELLLGKVARIESKLKIDYQFFLKVIQSEATNISDFLGKSLFGLESKKMIDSAEIELNGLKSGLVEGEYSEKVVELFGMESMVVGGNVKFVMGGKQMKRLKELRKEVVGREYEEYCVFREKVKRINEMEGNVKKWKSYAGDVLNGVICLLKEGEFIGVGGEILKKGVIAAQINECNAIVLTEMIVGGYFVGLSAEEIVGLLAIFIDETKTDDMIGLDDVVGTPKLKEYVSDLVDVVAQYQYLEESIGIEGSDDKYWSLSYDFIDAAYLWASAKNDADISKVFSAGVETMYVGNFIRSMIKINNIAKDLIHLCELNGDITPIPILSKIEGLVMKDFVTVNSLYLSN